MDELKNNKLFWIVAGITIFNVMFLFGVNLVVNKAADKVIEKLQKEYSPSPYGPGIDPDKIDPESLKKQSTYFKIPAFLPKEENAMWRNDWEKNRGFSHEQ